MFVEVIANQRSVVFLRHSVLWVVVEESSSVVFLRHRVLWVVAEESSVVLAVVCPRLQLL